MADIKLGLTKEAVESVKETYEGPRLPFPATKAGFTKYTGELTGIEVKQSQDGSRAWLWLQVTNGAHSETMLVNLDPSDVAPTLAADKVEGAVKRNLDTLLRAIKVLGISNASGDGIDTAKFPQAIGTLLSFGVKLGDMQQNGYYKYFTNFYGKAESLVTIDAPVGGATQPAGGGSDDDLPF